MNSPRAGILTICAMLIALLAAPAFAQTSGRISGTVRDPNGVPVPGVTVTVTNQDTLATRVVRSSTGGVYEVIDLPPGLYTVSADLPGYRMVVQRDRRLAGGAALTVDFGLELRAAEDVTVTAMKRDETLSKTPFSIAAPTEEVLRERGAEGRYRDGARGLRGGCYVSRGRSFPGRYCHGLEMRA